MAALATRFARPAPAQSLCCEMLKISLPVAGSALVQQSTTVITIFIVAGLDDPVVLGGVGLGLTIQNVFGFSLGVGMSSALDTLVSQSFGAGNHAASSQALGRARLVNTLVAVPSFVILWYTEQLLCLLRLDHGVAREAGNYVRGTVWSLWFYYQNQATQAFLRAQRITFPTFWSSVLALPVHAVLCWLLIHSWGYGASGAGWAMSCSNLARFVLLSGMVLVSPPTGLQVLPRWKEVFAVRPLVAYLAVAGPSALLIWSEWWAFELMSVIAGLCGPLQLAAHVSVSNILNLLYMVPYGVGQSVSTLVGNMVGAGDVGQAKTFIWVSTFWMSLGFTFVAAGVFACRWQLARLYSSKDEVMDLFSEICLVLAPFLVLDAAQTVLEGALKGLGLQGGASSRKLFSMIGVRLLGAYVLALPLRRGVLGIWWAGCLGMLVTVVLYWQLMVSADTGGIVEAARRQVNLQGILADGGSAEGGPA